MGLVPQRQKPFSFLPCQTCVFLRHAFLASKCVVGVERCAYTAHALRASSGKMARLTPRRCAVLAAVVLLVLCQASDVAGRKKNRRRRQIRVGSQGLRCSRTSAAQVFGAEGLAITSCILVKNKKNKKVPFRCFSGCVAPAETAPWRQAADSPYGAGGKQGHSLKCGRNGWIASEVLPRHTSAPQVLRRSVFADDCACPEGSYTLENETTPCTGDCNTFVSSYIDKRSLKCGTEFEGCIDAERLKLDTAGEFKCVAESVVRSSGQNQDVGEAVRVQSRDVVNPSLAGKNPTLRQNDPISAPILERAGDCLQPEMSSRMRVECSQNAPPCLLRSCPAKWMGWMLANEYNGDVVNLDLDDIGVDDEGCRVIAWGIAQQNGLTEINLEYNDLTDACAG